MEEPETVEARIIERFEVQRVEFESESENVIPIVPVHAVAVYVLQDFVSTWNTQDIPPETSSVLLLNQHTAQALVQSIQDALSDLKKEPR